MAKGTTEIMKLQHLYKHISEFAEKHECAEDKAFLLWYAKEVRGMKEPQIAYTDPQDGGIDMVLFGKDKITLVQGKYQRGTREHIKNFGKVIEAWGDKKSFDSWLKDVANQKAHKHYRQAFKLSAEMPLHWEFISLSDSNESWDRLLENRCEVGKDFTSQVIGKDDLLYYYMLDSVGARFTDDLELTIVNGHSLSWEEPGSGVATRIVILKVDELLKEMRREENPEIFFSRNVRLEVSESEVNKDILETYNTDPHGFFYGNNGIHILTTKASVEDDRITLGSPSIINGGQTIRTLLDSDTKKKGLILARITKVSKEKQIDPTTHKFVNDIIFRSNSNNEMKASDLRSNNLEQVRIAKALHSRKFFYERKTGEWKKLDADFNLLGHITSEDLAKLIFITKHSPAKLKKIGARPLFTRTKNGDYYKEIFGIAERDMDATESRIRVYFLAKKGIKTASGISDDYKSFRGAALNFVFALSWDLLCRAKMRHPFRPLLKHYTPRSLSAGLVREMGSITKELYDLFKDKIKSGEMTQNDIFRDASCWNKAYNTLITRNRVRQFKGVLARGDK
ncbi:MAG: AIPR family protein [Elusimicrobiales bacterium]|nr:AIPR family protein [Elusimicrobiales bacterium]